MARMNTASRATTDDLVDAFLRSPVVRTMRLYADMAGTSNPTVDAADALHAGRPAIVDSDSLPREIADEFFDTVRLTSVRLRLQRGQTPEVVDDRPPVVPELEEPTADTQPMEVTP